MVIKVIKSRKNHCTVRVGDDDGFICPVHKQRPCMTVAMCLGRQARRVRKCTSCRIPQQIMRKGTDHAPVQD